MNPIACELKPFVSVRANRQWVTIIELFFYGAENRTWSGTCWEELYLCLALVYWSSQPTIEPVLESEEWWWKHISYLYVLIIESLCLVLGGCWCSLVQYRHSSMMVILGWPPFCIAMWSQYHVTVLAISKGRIVSKLSFKKINLPF